MAKVLSVPLVSASGLHFRWGVAKLTNVTWNDLMRKLEAHSMPLEVGPAHHQVQEYEHSLECLRILYIALYTRCIARKRGAERLD